MTLELRGVSFRYPGAPRPSLVEVDLRVRDGEVVGIMGPNLAGKSTLCLVAAGLAPASTGGELRGAVVLDGAPIPGRQPHELVRGVGIVFPNPASQLSGVAATVFEEVAFGPINLGCEVAETVARTRTALAALGIERLAGRDPTRLSGGETQLVAIASMLATRPRHLVLDEPVSALDPGGRRLVGAALRSITAAGTGILVAEHDDELLASLGARVVAIDAGRLVAP